MFGNLYHLLNNSYTAQVTFIRFCLIWPFQDVCWPVELSGNESCQVLLFWDNHVSEVVHYIIDRLDNICSNLVPDNFFLWVTSFTTFLSLFYSSPAWKVARYKRTFLQAHKVSVFIYWEGDIFWDEVKSTRLFGLSLLHFNISFVLLVVNGKLTRWKQKKFEADKIFPD